MDSSKEEKTGRTGTRYATWQEVFEIARSIPEDVMLQVDFCGAQEGGVSGE